MQLAANSANPVARYRADDDASHQFAGLLIVSLFPALFWTALIAGVGAAIGYAPSPAALMTFGAAVTVFLALVTQALFSRS
jgi:hypothetical protein